MSPTTAVYTTAGAETNLYKDTGAGTSIGTDVEEVHDKEARTFTGAPEPMALEVEERRSDIDEDGPENPENAPVQEHTGTGTAQPYRQQEATNAADAGTNTGTGKGEKLPFKEQVKAYAKVRSGPYFDICA